jgi:signal transduction histidine kinase
MRRRLVITYLVLLAAVLLALAVPLGSNLAAGRTDEMVVDRLLDANRIASIAEPALREGRIQGLAEELSQYESVYGISAAVVNREALLVALAGDQDAFEAPLVQDRMREALAGARAGGTGTIWPWQRAPLTLAVPVTSNGEVIGAVVTLSPTGRLRTSIVRAWTVYTVIGFFALGVFVIVAGWLARWILRPVTELDDTALRIAAGHFDSRVPANAGPPELRHLARSFNAMADHVGGSLVRQRAFVAQASHQLRNPLGALRIRVDNLARFVQAPGVEEHKLLLEETERFALILDGLLNLARAERDQHNWELTDAAAVADDRVVAWAPLAEERGIALSRTGAGRARVRVVSTALDQSLDALIDNALKFAGPGASVVVDVWASNGHVDLSVTDDGPGLSEEDRARAADRLWRAPAVQNIDGAGLGLAIVTVLAEASGGQLTLSDAVPRGLRATLTVPAADTV